MCFSWNYGIWGDSTDFISLYTVRATGKNPPKTMWYHVIAVLFSSPVNTSQHCPTVAVLWKDQVLLCTGLGSRFGRCISTTCRCTEPWIQWPLNPHEGRRMYACDSWCWAMCVTTDDEKNLWIQSTGVRLKVTTLAGVWRCCDIMEVGSFITGWIVGVRGPRGKKQRCPSLIHIIKGSLVANFRYTNFWVAWQE